MFLGQSVLGQGAMQAIWPRVSFSNILHSGTTLSKVGSNTIRKTSSSSLWICRHCREHSFSPEALRPVSVVTQAKNHRPIDPAPFLKSALRHASTSNESSNITNSAAREDLPSKKEDRRSHISKRFTHVMDNVQSRVFIAGQRINDLTGYSGIENLKKDIEEKGLPTHPGLVYLGSKQVTEQLVQEARKSLRDAKEAYSNAISQRSASQREVNELLQRKHAWSSQDLERFTALYRSDHANEQSEATAEKEMAAAERAAEEAAAKLNGSILARYHEEQIWSDKIRRMSTWGTWGLMGVNVFLFLVFQIGVEPWRRKRLVKGFEDKVMEALEKENVAHPPAPATVVAVPNGTREGALNSSIPAAVPMVNADVFPTADSLISKDLKDTPKSQVEDAPINTTIEGEKSWQRFLRVCKVMIQDLFSDRAISVRRVDLTAKAIEGTFAGIAIASLVGMLLRKN